MRSARGGHKGKTQATPKGTKASFPAHTDFELATLVDEVPAGDAWLHEIKFDGYRLMAKVAGGHATLLTRGGQDWTARFPAVAEAIQRLPISTALLDGEIVVLDDRGISDFQLLQNVLAQGAARPPQYFVFDLLYLQGRDLRHLALTERKRALFALLGSRAKNAHVLHYCEDVVGRGESFYAQACEHGLEGVVSKRADRPYVGGRTRDWLKTKCSLQQEFVIGGFTEPAGSRQNLGALLLGVHEKGRFLYTGKVGTGFTQESLADLRQRLRPLERKVAPFDDVPRAESRGAHWVEPALVAEVRFTGFTQGGRLRHPTFRGLREDKLPRDVVREAAQPGRT